MVPCWVHRSRSACTPKLGGCLLCRLLVSVHWTGIVQRWTRWHVGKVALCPGASLVLFFSHLYTVLNGVFIACIYSVTYSSWVCSPTFYQVCVSAVANFIPVQKSISKEGLSGRSPVCLMKPILTNWAAFYGTRLLNENNYLPTSQHLPCGGNASILKLTVGSMPFCVVFRENIWSYFSLSCVFRGYELSARSWNRQSNWINRTLNTHYKKFIVDWNAAWQNSVLDKKEYCLQKACFPNLVCESVYLASLWTVQWEEIGPMCWKSKFLP